MQGTRQCCGDDELVDLAKDDVRVGDDRQADVCRHGREKFQKSLHDRQGGQSRALCAASTVSLEVSVLWYEFSVTYRGDQSPV